MPDRVSGFGVHDDRLRRNAALPFQVYLVHQDQLREWRCLDEPRPGAHLDAVRVLPDFRRKRDRGTQPILVGMPRRVPAPIPHASKITAPAPDGGNGNPGVPLWTACATR